MWLLSQYSSQHCGAYTYILAVVEYSSSSNLSNRLRQLHPTLSLFLVHNYLPLAHNLNKGYRFPWRYGCASTAPNFRNDPGLASQVRSTFYREQSGFTIC